MRQNRLLILGASVRWLMQSASRVGLDVAGVDFFADVDAAAAGPVWAVKSWLEMVSKARELSPSAIILGGGLETQADLRQAVRQLAPLWNCSEEAIAASRSPEIWVPAISAAGIRCPRWGVPGCSGFPERQSGLQPGRRWLVKQRFGAGGNGIREWPGLALSGSPPLAPDEYCQEWVDGDSVSAQFLIDKGGEVTVELYQQLCGDAIFGARPYQYCGAIGPLETTGAQRLSLLELGRILYRELRLIGMVGVDLVRNGDELFLLEINPRPTATMELLERGGRCKSLVAWQAQQFVEHACLEAELSGVSIKPAGATELRTGKAILFWKSVSPLEIDVTRAELLQEWYAAGWLGDVPSRGLRIALGEPVATLFANGRTPVEVYRQLQHQADRVLVGLAGSTD